MQQILATFFERWKFKHPRPGDLFQIASEVSRRDLTPFFDQVYRGSAVFDYSVESIDTEDIGEKAVRSDVVVRRHGDGIFPVTILVTLANGDDADRLLASGELVAVWPEGFKGIGKPFSERYRLQRFGRGGFVATALRTQVPIIPTAIVGSEEIYPLLVDLKPLARMLGLPYLPVTAQMLASPLIGPAALLPLPSKWSIEYGDPIDTSEYGPEAADDPMVVFDLADQVRETIQHMLYRTLMGRRSVFF